MPVVSVVMAVYNGEKHLNESVSSIINQTFRDFEFIIVDDGSTDSTPILLREFSRKDNRIKIIRQENAGLPNALNRGILEAKGKYIARMDADDISLPDRFAKQVEFLERNQDVGLCGTACRLIGDSSGVSWTTTDPDEIKCRLLFWPCITHSTAMMNKDLLVENNLLYNPNYKQAEDYELWARLSKICKIANLPDILLLYRVTGGQKSKKFADEVTRYSAEIQRKLFEDMGLMPTKDEMELHISLYKSSFKKSFAYVENVEQWLCKIIEANKLSHTYNDTALKRVLMERWKSVCMSNMGLGLKVWRKYKKFACRCLASESEAWSEISILSCARKFLSCKLETTSYGKAIKHSVRSIRAILQYAGGQFREISWWKAK